MALNALVPHCDVELVETPAARPRRASSRPRPLPRGFDGVAAMGGDGTANEVLNGTGDALPVGVLPAGGTSVLPRALGMPRNVGAAAQLVARRAARGTRAQDQPGCRQRQALRIRGRGRRRCAGRAARRRRRPRQGPAAGRRLLRGADRAYAAARRLPRAPTRGLDRRPGRRARRQRVRRQRASLELSGAVRTQARAARDFEGGLDVVVPATCAGGTCRAMPRSCS